MIAAPVIAAPLIAVVRGTPTDEELAAVTLALLASLAAPPPQRSPVPGPGWHDHGYHPPGGWAQP